MDRWDDRLTLRTNLIESYQSLMAFIRKHLPDKFYLDGDRRLDLRELIFREIVANVIIHREYTNPLSTELIIYKDKVSSTNPNKPFLGGPLQLESFNPYPKNPLLRKFFSEMGWADEVGSGVKNVNKYVKFYTSPTAEPLFIDDDVFKTTVPLIVYTFGERVDDILELLDIEKSSLSKDLLTNIRAIDIPGIVSQANEKIDFLGHLVPSWIEVGTQFDGLKLNNIAVLDNPELFKVPTSYKKGTNLLGKKLTIVLKILLKLTLPSSLEKLMSFINYKNKKSFRELYLQPLLQNSLIKRTIPENLNDPNQEYAITRKGRLFLGGFPID
jgi:ATP-dependent DNA helicase RecG